MDEGQSYTLLETLQKESRELNNLLVDARRSYRGYDMACLYKNKGTEYGPISREERNINVWSKPLTSY